jgi:hypothetical protein
MNVLPEPFAFALTVTKGLAVLGLIVLYLIGVWLRNFVLPADATLPLKRQLGAAVPVAFLTMGAYAKTALPPLFTGGGDVFPDVAIMIGYAIFLGMMSREALEKLMKTGLHDPNAPN